MIILTIAGSACLALLWVEAGGAAWLKRALRWPYDRRLKPFDCELCLAWWMGLSAGVPSGTFQAGLTPFVATSGRAYVWLGPAWASINFETLSLFPLYTGGCAAILAILLKKLLR